MGDAGVVDGEVDFGEGKVDGGRSGGDGSGGVEDELPLGVGEEDAEGGVGEEEGDEDYGGEGFEDPGDFDEGDHLGGGVASLRVVAGSETGGGAGGGLGFAWCGLRHFADGFRISHPRRESHIHTCGRVTVEAVLRRMLWASGFGCAGWRRLQGWTS